MPIDHLDWEYDPHGEHRPWTAGSCLFLAFMLIVFWVTVIGGGIWLATTFN